MRKRMAFEPRRWPAVLFSSPRARLMDVFSVALVGLGVMFWIWPIQILRSQAGGFTQADGMLRSLFFIFLATQLTTVGVAFYAYSLSTRLRSREEEDAESALDKLEALLTEQKRNGSGVTPTIRLDLESLRSSSSKGGIARVHILAVTEGVMVLLLYGWLVQEFESNVHMQGWVRNNLPFLGYLLNGYALFLMVGLLGGILFSELLASGIKRRPAPRL